MSDPPRRCVLHVRILGHDNVDVETTSDTTWLGIKEEIAHQTHHAVEAIRLIFGGRVLNDDGVVSEILRDEDEAVLHGVLRRADAILPSSSSGTMSRTDSGADGVTMHHLTGLSEESMFPATMVVGTIPLIIPSSGPSVGIRRSHSHTSMDSVRSQSRSQTGITADGMGGDGSGSGNQEGGPAGFLPPVVENILQNIQPGLVGPGSFQFNVDYSDGISQPLQLHGRSIVTPTAVTVPGGAAGVESQAGREVIMQPTEGERTEGPRVSSSRRGQHILLRSRRGTAGNRERQRGSSGRHRGGMSQQMRAAQLHTRTNAYLSKASDSLLAAGRGLIAAALTLKEEDTGDDLERGSEAEPGQTQPASASTSMPSPVVPGEQGPPVDESERTPIQTTATPDLTEMTAPPVQLPPGVTAGAAEAAGQAMREGAERTTGGAETRDARWRMLRDSEIYHLLPWRELRQLEQLVEEFTGARLSEPCGNPSREIHDDRTTAWFTFLLRLLEVQNMLGVMTHHVIAWQMGRMAMDIGKLGYQMRAYSLVSFIYARLAVLNGQMFSALTGQASVFPDRVLQSMQWTCGDVDLDESPASTVSPRRPDNTMIVETSEEAPADLGASPVSTWDEREPTNPTGRPPPAPVESAALADDVQSRATALDEKRVTATPAEPSQSRIPVESQRSPPLPMNDILRNVMGNLGQPHGEQQPNLSFSEAVATMPPHVQEMCRVWHAHPPRFSAAVMAAARNTTPHSSSYLSGSYPDPDVPFSLPAADMIFQISWNRALSRLHVPTDQSLDELLNNDLVPREFVKDTLRKIAQVLHRSPDYQSDGMKFAELQALIEEYKRRN